jgi:hypothetical protein
VTTSAGIVAALAVAAFVLVSMLLGSLALLALVGVCCAALALEDPPEAFVAWLERVNKSL